ncbi:CaiB/BaiF CoA transferase family protein [Gordonia sp. NPDC003424]
MTTALSGVRVIEIGSIGPGPHAALMLANLGADVIRVDRPVPGVEMVPPDVDDILRNRRTVLVDLKADDDREQLLRLIEQADVLLEGFRPGVTERLGIGPDICLDRNPRLVYARITGWGQNGPMAQIAGHDMNYLALSGALHSIGHPGTPPLPPLNLLADYGGGSMLAVQGILAALLERERSGAGQVVDIAMIDGVNTLMALYWNQVANDAWSTTPGENTIDGGAPFYNTYECADGRYVAVGAVETPFYAALLDGLDLSADLQATQMDRTTWPELKKRFAALFAARSRDEWVTRFDGRDACVTPVLTLDEAAQHPHLTERGCIETHWGRRQPAPAPRFSRSRPESPRQPGKRIELGAAIGDWTVGRSASVVS